MKRIKQLAQHYLSIAHEPTVLYVSWTQPLGSKHLQLNRGQSFQQLSSLVCMSISQAMDVLAQSPWQIALSREVTYQPGIVHQKSLNHILRLLGCVEQGKAGEDQPVRSISAN
jgi:hypothetical protein